MPGPPREHGDGPTLVELMVGLVLLLIFGGAAVMATQRSVERLRRSARSSAMDAEIARALDRITREIVGAGRETLVPDAAAPHGSPTLDFRTPTDYRGTRVVWGEPTRLVWELAPGELDNGTDDDGDGLVDEGIVVRILGPDQPDEQRLVIARGVSELLEGERENGADDNGNGLIDERGLSFQLLGDMLIVRLTMKQSGPDRELLVRTLETSVRLRN